MANLRIVVGRARQGEYCAGRPSLTLSAPSRVPPAGAAEPAAMARLVARKRFTSKKGDLPMVIALNTRTILSIFRDMKMVKYVGTFNERRCSWRRCCRCARRVSTIKNQIGDEGAVALAEAVGKGALPKLEILGLSESQIGDEGVSALAEAVGKGALPGSRNSASTTTSFLRRQRTRWRRSRRRGAG